MSYLYFQCGHHTDILWALLPFLVADTQLYKRLCPSVCRSVRPLVHNDRVKKWENGHFCPCPLMAVYPALFCVSSYQQRNYWQKLFFCLALALCLGSHLLAQDRKCKMHMNIGNNMQQYQQEAAAEDLKQAAVF